MRNHKFVIEVSNISEGITNDQIQQSLNYLIAVGLADAKESVARKNSSKASTVMQRMEHDILAEVATSVDIGDAIPGFLIVEDSAS